MKQKKNSPNLPKSTINRNSPGSYQEDDKHTNLGSLGNCELSTEDADEATKGNVDNDNKVPKYEASVTSYPKNANVMEESDAEGDRKLSDPKAMV